MVDVAQLSWLNDMVIRSSILPGSLRLAEVSLDCSNAEGLLGFGVGGILEACITGAKGKPLKTLISGFGKCPTMFGSMVGKMVEHLLVEEGVILVALL